MESPWFNPKLAWLVPFFFCGIIGGTYGTFVGILYGKDKYRSFMSRLSLLLTLMSVWLLLIGIVALICKQPLGIWLSFCISGLVGYFCFWTCGKLFRTTGPRHPSSDPPH